MLLSVACLIRQRVAIDILPVIARHEVRVLYSPRVHVIAPFTRLALESGCRTNVQCKPSIESLLSSIVIRVGVSADVSHDSTDTFDIVLQLLATNLLLILSSDFDILYSGSAAKLSNAFSCNLWRMQSSGHTSAPRGLPMVPSVRRSGTIG